MTAAADAIALLRARVSVHRIGKSAYREMDQDILAMRKAIEILEQDPIVDRMEFAHMLDELHGSYVTEGGCDFHPVHRGWRIGEHPRPDAEIIDPILSAIHRGGS